MDSCMPLVLLACVCTHAAGEPLPEAVQRRSDMFGVYASEYAREYKPVAYAAIPLHAPIPVFHIISPVPLKQPHRYDHRHTSQSAQRPVYAHPYVYAASMNQYLFDGPESTPPTILYARPNPQGGFTYRRRPTKHRSPPKRSATKEPPVIIRVHKYKIIRDR